MSQIEAEQCNLSECSASLSKVLNQLNQVEDFCHKAKQAGSANTDMVDEIWNVENMLSNIRTDVRQSMSTMVKLLKLKGARMDWLRSKEYEEAVERKAVQDCMQQAHAISETQHRAETVVDKMVSAAEKQPLATQAAYDLAIESGHKLLPAGQLLSQLQISFQTQQPTFMPSPSSAHSTRQGNVAFTKQATTAMHTALHNRHSERQHSLTSRLMSCLQEARTAAERDFMHDNTVNDSSYDSESEDSSYDSDVERDSVYFDNAIHGDGELESMYTT